MTATTLVRTGISRFRTIADELVWPTATTVPSARAAVLAAGCVLGGALVVLLRQTGTPAVDTLYAEDGQIFLAQAYERGIPATLLEPWAGYSHLLPRLLTAAVAMLPLHWAAASMAIGAALLTSALALVTYRALSGVIRSAALRGVVAAAVLLVPVGQEEIFSSVANLHWFLVPVTALVLLWNPASRLDVGLAAVVVFLAAASDPVVAVLLPLAALRLFTRVPASRIPSAAFMAGLTVQLVVIATGAGTRPFTGTSPGPAKLLAWLAFDVPGRTLAGTRWVGDISDPVAWLGVGVALIALGAVCVACLRFLPSTDWWPPLVLVVAGVVLYLGYAGVAGDRPPRYAVPSAILLLAALGIAADRLWRAMPDRSARLAAVVAALAVAGVWSVNLRLDNGRSDGPIWSEELAVAENRCRTAPVPTVAVPIAPDAPLAIQLPCRALVATN